MTLHTENEQAGGGGSGPLIYLVDDEPMILDLTRDILQPKGYALRCFRDPAQALEAFTAADPKPDLVLTDYAMGTMTGVELMLACRKARPGQKVLLVSGTVGPEICGEGEMGPNAFMAKPFDAKALADLVWQLTHQP